MYGFLLIVHFSGTSFTNNYHPFFVYFTICIIFSFYFTSCLHELRHSHASMLIEMKFDILEISERLGHESVQTTWDTYSHLYPDKDVKLAGRLNELRRPERT